MIFVVVQKLSSVTNHFPLQMVKSKSAGYICPKLRAAKLQRFSLIEDSSSLEEAEEDHRSLETDTEEDVCKSLLPPSNAYNRYDPGLSF